jgi:catechol 2,3-dioxygenase-like lactoylglutathione lyase family enzyme
VFSRLDTVILRVRDLAAARAWYATRLGLHAVYEDATQGLAVLGLEGGSSLTLWAAPRGEGISTSSTFPIFAVADARAAHARLAANGVPAEPLVEAPGVCYFRFADLDGNPLEACEVLVQAQTPDERAVDPVAG